MYNYINKFISDSKIYMYNLLYSDYHHCRKKYQNLSEDITYNVPIHMNEEELKKYRINTILYIKQCKNTYYKYTQSNLFNQKLYESQNDDTHFDSGDTGYDDDDNVSIFDKYILEYIKQRNEIMTHFQCKNIKVNLKNKLEDLQDFRNKQDEKDILFVIDMSDKQIFDYCSEIQKCYTINETKMITLSMVIKYEKEYIRIKLNSQISNKDYHSRLILENYINVSK